MAKSHPARCVVYRVGRHARLAHAVAGSHLLLVFLVLASILVYRHWAAPVRTAITQAVAVAQPPVAAVEPMPMPEATVEDPEHAKYRAIGDYLARRYRVSADMTAGIVAKAHDIGRSFKVDPLLILAVIAVESRFNPVAESAMGAKGLMQVIPRFHPEKFHPLGGEKAAFEPRANITVGAHILGEYIRRTGDVGDALQLYVGASSEANENGYSAKVLLERGRLVEVLRQFKAQTRESRGA